MTILPQKETWLTVKEYAAKYKVSLCTVYRMIKSGRLTIKQFGSTYRIRDYEEVAV